MKTVGIITIHGICNFGSLLQAYATQKVVESLGYAPQIINYKYPNDYHQKESQKHSPYARVNYSFFQRVRLAIYGRILGKHNSDKRHALYEKERTVLLYLTEEYPNQASLHSKPPLFDIYLTGSDQVWNPRYMYSDCTYMLNFIHNVPKIAYSASFGTTNLTNEYKDLYKSLLNEYVSISMREQSGVGMIKAICGKESTCTCDPTLLLSGEEWADLFGEKPLVNGEYILCYILTYTANPYPYASAFISHIQTHLKKKVVILDELGRYWMDFRYKSFQSAGPREIVNLFKNAAFIISSSFHGAAFSINFKKDFYSLFPADVKDERQESLLKIVGAEDRFIHVGDPFPEPSAFRICDWDSISVKLAAYRQKSIDYLIKALGDAAKLTK